MTAQEFPLIRQLLRGDCPQEVSLPRCAFIERLFSAQELALIRQLLRGDCSQSGKPLVGLQVEGGLRGSHWKFSVYW